MRGAARRVRTQWVPDGTLRLKWEFPAGTPKGGPPPSRRPLSAPVGRRTLRQRAARLATRPYTAVTNPSVSSSINRRIGCARERKRRLAIRKL